MFSRIGIVVLLWVAIQSACAQSHSADKSPNDGQLVTSPESLSGIWEAPDGNGGMVGIHLQMITRIPGSTTSPVGVKQLWEHLAVGVFQTKSSLLQFGDQNYFSDSRLPGHTRFDSDHLLLHFVSPSAQLPSVDLDLTRIDDTWKGRLHRGQFDTRVELRRPEANVEAWFEDSPGARTCVHIPNSTASEFNGWSDNFPTFGNVRYGNKLPRPSMANATYGDLIKIRHLNDGQISIEFNAYSATCCPHLFVGTISQDGKLLVGSWPAGPNQAPHQGSFRKTSDHSCLDF